MKRFNEYIDMLKDKDIVNFCSSPNYRSGMFVKQDAVMSYFPEFNTDRYYSYAGAMIIKKTSKMMSFMNDWLSLCETYNFLDRSPSVHFKETSQFVGNDVDNGLFNLVLSKYSDISYDIYPSEVNIYSHDGKQMDHMGYKTHPNTWDWSKLDNFPIQYRRDRARR
jgi:hypothetical protein